MSQIAKILIVDDHPTTREGLKEYLDRCPELQVCGVADDIRSALSAAAAEQPDIVVVDINLRECSGLDLIRELRRSEGGPPVLAWSMHDHGLFAQRAIKAGASGYVSKMQRTEDVVTSIRAILENGSTPGPSNMPAPKRRQGNKNKPSGPGTVEDLSDRELQVLQMMGEGLDMRQMMLRTQLSPKTIETYRARIKQKFGLETNAQLIRHAVQFVLECRARGEPS